MSRAGRSAAAVVAAAVSLALATVVVACQAQPPDGSARPGTSNPGQTDASATLGSPPSPSPDLNLPAEIDQTLLAYLPETVGDATVEENVEEAATAVANPNLSSFATAVDVGIALDTAGGNLVTAHVVKLREGAFGEPAFRAWRDTFDSGACAAAGGVKGRAESTIDDRTVFVTTCVSQLRTYHAWIEDEDLLISAASIGEGNFGELLMNSLRIE